jgi:hypothetical protein
VKKSIEAANTAPFAYLASLGRRAGLKNCQIQRLGIDAQCSCFQIFAKLAKQAVGNKIGTFRAKDDFAENDILKDESQYHEKYNCQY